MESAVPDELRQFIAKYIRSLDQLEVLLLVSALPDREWTADDVYNVVRSNPAVVSQRLENFVKEGMLARSGELYRYQPRTEALSRAISMLSATYKTSRHRIVELIYSTSSSDQALTGFSDAFRFKKKD